MFMKFLAAIVLLLLPAIAQAADISGIPKIREGDQIECYSRVEVARTLASPPIS